MQVLETFLILFFLDFFLYFFVFFKFIWNRGKRSFKTWLDTQEAQTQLSLFAFFSTAVAAFFCTFNEFFSSFFFFFFVYWNWFCSNMKKMQVWKWMEQVKVDDMAQAFFGNFKKIFSFFFWILKIFQNNFELFKIF